VYKQSLAGSALCGYRHRFGALQPELNAKAIGQDDLFGGDMRRPQRCRRFARRRGVDRFRNVGRGKKAVGFYVTGHPLEAISTWSPNSVRNLS